MAASFGSATFKEAGGGQWKREAVKSRAVIHEIAGGGYVIQRPDINATPARTITIRAQGTGAQIAALQDAVDTVNTLAWSGGSQSDMLLVEVGEPEEVSVNADIVQAACTWRHLPGAS